MVTSITVSGLSPYTANRAPGLRRTGDLRPRAYLERRGHLLSAFCAVTWPHTHDVEKRPPNANANARALHHLHHPAH